MKFTRVRQHLFKSNPGGYYYLIWKSNGQKQRLSLKTKDFQTATVRLRDKLSAVKAWKRHDAKITFEKLAKRWEATDLAGRDLKRSSREDRLYHVTAIYRQWPSLQRTRIIDITAARCQQWKARRLRSISAQRLNNEVGTLKQILAFAVRHHLLLDNPAADLVRVRVPRSIVRCPSRAQFVTLVQYLRTKNDLYYAWKQKEAVYLVELLAYSGMRLNECASLLWEDVHFDRNEILITGGEKGTKNRENRLLPLFTPLRKRLESITRRPGDPRVLRIWNCRDAFQQACDKLGFPRYKLHSLRHFFITNMVEEGIDYRTIADWVGHRDGGVLIGRVYGHLRRDRAQELAKRITFSVDEPGILTTAVAHQGSK